MTKTCLRNLQCLLLAILVTVMTGCGASNTAGTAGSDSGNASLTAKLVWSDTAKNTAKAVAAIPAGEGDAKIVTMRMTVTGTGANGAIPVVRTDIAVTEETTGGKVVGVYPGTVTLAVQALNGKGEVLYEGYALKLAVSAGAETDAGTIYMTPPVVKVADTGCLNCHENKLDITGQSLVANYKQSGHYTNSTTGCAACHDGKQHNNDLSPAASGKCFSCHGSLGLKHQNPLSVGDATPARYLNADGTNCSACHEPHNPINGVGKQERKDWAESAHGDVHGAAWEHYDFTVKDACNACHTAAGFAKAIGSNWADTTPLVTTSVGKHPLTCDGCHSSNDFKNSVRQIEGGYTAGMGGFGAKAKASVKFSDQGQSNLCFPCHVGRENGDSLMAGKGTAAVPVPYDFTNQGFVNPHYLSSAAVWQGVAGFKFYSSSTRYGLNRPTHGVLTEDLASVGHSFNSRMTPEQLRLGSCVACHLGLKNNHTFEVFDAVKNQFNTGAEVTGCLGCHGDTNNGRDRYRPTEAVASVRTRLASGGDVQALALDFLAWQLEAVGIKYAPSYPYFYYAGGTTAAKNWTIQIPAAAALNPAAYANALTDPQALGLQTMGSAMNLAVLLGDKGAAAHNANFVRHAIGDSLVFLQHGNVGDRTSTAAIDNISFTAYSTARTPVGGGLPISGNPASIGYMKAFLTTWKTDGSVQQYTRK